MDQFLGNAGVEALEDLTALSLKRSIAGERERGLADNTVRGSFEVVKGQIVTANRWLAGG